MIQRTKTNVRLFDAKEGGNEIAFDATTHEATIKTGKTYWIQGTETPSTTVQETKLKARPKGSSDYLDTVSVTVLWVTLVVRTESTADISKPEPDIYDGQPNVAEDFGVTKRGVQASTVLATSALGVIEIQGGVQPVDIKQYDINNRIPNSAITTGLTDPPFDPADPERKPTGPATATFGFVFRRYIDGKRYTNGQNGSVVTSDGTPQVSKGIDDSPGRYQDVKPTTRTVEGVTSTAIVDVDAPEVAVAKKGAEDYAGHTRLNFKEYTVFHFISTMPERCSRIQDWFFTGDIARNYTDGWSYIYDKANSGEKNNEVSDGALPNLNLNIPKANMMAAVVEGAVAGQEKKLPAAGGTIVISGTNLMGKAVLRKAGANDIVATYIKVKQTDPNAKYSDLTEVKAAFGPNAAGGGYSLVIVNAAGDSNLVDGFSIE